MLYIILALSALVPAVWVIFRRKDITLAATYFMAAAFVHTADWIASGVFGLYKYHPGLFSSSALDDASGVFLAELVFVGSFAVLLAALTPRWWAALVGSAVVTTLEFNFHRVGALEYNGWMLPYTTFGFMIYFFLVRSCWLSAGKQGTMCGWPRALQRLSLAIVFNGTFEILMWGVQAVEYPVTLLPTKIENQALLRLLWHFGVSVPLLYFALAGKCRTWRLVAAILLSIALSRIFLSAGIREYQEPWTPELAGLVQAPFFALACLVDHLLRPRSPIPPWEPPVWPRSHKNQ